MSHDDVISKHLYCSTVVFCKETLRMLRSSKATVASTKSGQWGLEKQALSSITRHTSAERVDPPNTIIVLITNKGLDNK